MLDGVESHRAADVEASEIDYLHRLDALLRSAIRASLMHGAPTLAVALDTARDFVEDVIADPAPTASRVALARARAEIALDAWRQQAARILAPRRVR